VGQGAISFSRINLAISISEILGLALWSGPKRKREERAGKGTLGEKGHQKGRKKRETSNNCRMPIQAPLKRKGKPRDKLQGFHLPQLKLATKYSSSRER